MPTTKASTRAVNKYMNKAYDRINFIVKKGQKEIIGTAAAAAGQSVNGYIWQAVQERMERDSSDASKG